MEKVDILQMVTRKRGAYKNKGGNSVKILALWLDKQKLYYFVAASDKKSLLDCSEPFCLPRNLLIKYI
jgi:hypothetical protein